MGDAFSEANVSIDYLTSGVEVKIEHTTRDTVRLEPSHISGRHFLVSLMHDDEEYEPLLFGIDHIAKKHDVFTIFSVLNEKKLSETCKGSKEEFRKEVMVKLHKVAKQLNEDREIDIKFRVHAEFHSHPGQCILDKINGKMVEKDCYSMIIAGCRLLTALEKLLIGSVSTFLLQKSPIPVILVRDYRRIVTNTNSGSEKSFLRRSISAIGSMTRLSLTRKSTNSQRKFGEGDDQIRKSMTIVNSTTL